jgi:hypothetical protein
MSDETKYESRGMVCKEVASREAVYTLLMPKFKGSYGQEVKFDKVQGDERMYHASFIPANTNIIYPEIPSIEGFNLEAMSGDISTLEKTLDAIINVAKNPEVVRVIKSLDKKAYAIFVR